MSSRVVRGGIPARLYPVLPILLILALATAALWPSPASLLRYWREIMDYQHGFLVAVIVLLWMGRELWRGAAEGGKPSLIAGVALFPVLLLWVVATRGGIDILHQLLWPIILGVSVWAVAGSHVARRLAIPFGLLYTAIPIWDYGLPILQRLSIFSTEHILGLLGVPATVEEFRVTIPEGTFAIVEGCSGKRYFVVTMAVAYLAIALNGLRGWRALLFLAIAGLMSMLVNWIRIVIVIYAGHTTDMQHYFVAIEHNSLGNALFAVLIVAVLLLARCWSGRTATRGSVNTAPQGTDSGATRFGPALLVPAALLLLGLVASSVHQVAEGARLGALPIATASWIGPLPSAAGWKPAYARPDDERRVAYVHTSGTVELYANLYADQSSGRELIHYGNNIAAPLGWTLGWNSQLEPIDVAGLPLQVLQLKGPDERWWLLTRTYVVNGRTIRSELAAKLAYGWFSITGEAPSGVLAAASVCNARNCNNARKLLADFWNNIRIPMEAMMPTGSQSER